MAIHKYPGIHTVTDATGSSDPMCIYSLWDGTIQNGDKISFQRMTKTNHWHVNIDDDGYAVIDAGSELGADSFLVARAEAASPEVFSDGIEVTFTLYSLGDPPVFTTRLTPQTEDEGTPLQFGPVAAKGTATISLTWFAETSTGSGLYEPIADRYPGRVNLSQTGQHVDDTLEITGTTPADTGNIKVEASNAIAPVDVSIALATVKSVGVAPLPPGDVGITTWYTSGGNSTDNRGIENPAADLGIGVWTCALGSGRNLGPFQTAGEQQPLVFNNQFYRGYPCVNVIASAAATDHRYTGTVNKPHTVIFFTSAMSVSGNWGTQRLLTTFGSSSRNNIWMTGGNIGVHCGTLTDTTIQCDTTLEAGAMMWVHQVYHTAPDTFATTRIYSMDSGNIIAEDIGRACGAHTTTSGWVMGTGSTFAIDYYMMEWMYRDDTSGVMTSEEEEGLLAWARARWDF